MAFGDADADVPPQLVRDYATAARATTVASGRLVGWVWWGGMVGEPEPFLLRGKLNIGRIWKVSVSDLEVVKNVSDMLDV